ncbi:MAG: pentapeptide repeat-containing protein [Chloroflexi bacterium]|nr:pentapeptide repeat-containing protein [Chloroflexota bacterium]
MTNEQRRDISNGIWLCRKCARLIDTDEEKYPVELLLQWRHEHEKSIEALQTGQVTEDTQQQAILETYFDRVTELLLEQDIRFPGIQCLARTRTLSALRRLDSIRKSHLLAFLYEAQLITLKPGFLKVPAVNLEGADLKGAYLKSAQLDNVYLRGVDLSGADLSSASLRGADLAFANLAGTNLQCSDLEETIVSCANLQGANLREARLCNADLRSSNLQNTNLILSSLSGARCCHVKLQYADLNHSSLEKTDFLSADLSYADISNAYLNETDISYAKLDFVKLDNIELRPDGTLVGTVTTDREPWESWGGIAFEEYAREAFVDSEVQEE